MAESGATWLGEEDVDPQLLQKLHHAVETVVETYEGDETVFEDASREVQQHLQAAARKAELAERRQVEAARGKDRLEIAKHRAAETIESAMAEYSPVIMSVPAGPEVPRHTPMLPARARV